MNAKEKALEAARRTARAAWLPVVTDDGTFSSCFSNAGLAELRFPGYEPTSFSGGNESHQTLEWKKQTDAAIRRILHGLKPDSIPPLDLRGATAFQLMVWHVLMRIPPGTTITYAQLAASIGKPTATRAIGSACGANPIPLLIPCHRVVRADGASGGFSAGSRWKNLLLDREKAALS